MEKLRDIYMVAKQEYENQIISYIDFDKIEKDYHYSMANYKVAEANLTNGIAKLGVIEELLRHTKSMRRAMERSPNGGLWRAMWSKSASLFLAYGCETHLGTRRISKRRKWSTSNRAIRSISHRCLSRSKVHRNHLRSARLSRIAIFSHPA